MCGMTKAEEFLTKLQEREPELFSGPLQKSNLTDGDLQEIEKALGYAVPQQYREFLQSFCLSDLTVYIAFCGDKFACSFEETFYRAAALSCMSDLLFQFTAGSCRSKTFLCPAAGSCLSE